MSQDIRSARGDLRYGEIEFWAFVSLLEDVQPRPGEVFCDIGAGTGKAVIAARLLYPELELSFGVEVQTELARTLRGTLSDKSLKGHGLLGSAYADLRDRQCNLFLSDGEMRSGWPMYARSDIVFVASTAFSDALMSEFSVRVREVKVGARVLTLTKPLVGHEGYFRLKFCRPYRFGWGSNATVYCWERV